LRASSRWGVAAALLIFGASCAWADQARAQVEYPMPTSFPASITKVLDGDTVEAQLDDGRHLTVQLIGIDAPETSDCGGKSAASRLRQLAQGKRVSLVIDSTQGSTDSAGRALFYADRSDGVDVGEQMLRGGWAKVFVADADFQRISKYRTAQRASRKKSNGVWARCAGDFHLTRAEILRAKRRSAERFMRRYYSNLSHHRFRTAWKMLGSSLHKKNGSFAHWRAGYRHSLGTRVRSAHARLSRRRAIVAVALRSRDRDVCSGKTVRQYFRGKWVLTPRGKTWVAVKVRIRKTAGRHVRLSKSECPRPKPHHPPAPHRAPSNCQGYSPCIQPGPDVDCAGGSGNGPRYVQGPVTVTGSDPYDLDRDGDGVACED
jgi:endonuclease YncB( thermonuclease family)